VQFILAKLEESERRVISLSQKVEELEKELRRIKKLPPKPKLKPSTLDKDIKKSISNKSRQTGKRNKKETLEIHETKKIKLTGLPLGWKLVGYESRVRQDLIIRANNIEYLLEIWKNSNGEKRVASLPQHLQNTHFGATLKAFIIHQYYECGVTQPLIHSSLKDYGIDISSGQINWLLTEDKESFHKEKESLLSKGIELSEELRTDDTGARHQFRNGFCNCINSSLFTYFTTTYSKSRINFLEILRQGKRDYQINETSLSYIQKEIFAGKYYETLKRSYARGERIFENKSALEEYFKREGITAKYAIQRITEALLIGAIIEHGFDPRTVIHSDGAGQFNLFVHSLCWKHAERPLVQLKFYNRIQQDQLEKKKFEYWELYQMLKHYKKEPDKKMAFQLEQRFDSLCKPIENYASINLVLADLNKRKDQLLVVLDRPKTSLHNNDSERDIREYVKRRKISSGTRSENGRKARDTFLSLKKTCRKLEISFWSYLLDRTQNLQIIPPLSQVMAQKQQVSFL
jgi:hypothetical protein